MLDPQSNNPIFGITKDPVAFVFHANHEIFLVVVVVVEDCDIVMVAAPVVSGRTAQKVDVVGPVFSSGSNTRRPRHIVQPTSIVSTGRSLNRISLLWL